MKMFQRLATVVAAAAVVSVSAPTIASAQGTCIRDVATSATCAGVTLPISVTVQEFAKLFVDAGANTALSVPSWVSADSTQFEAGLPQTDADIARLRVATNAGYKVQVAGAWTAGTKTNGVADVEWTVNGGTNYSVLTGTAADMFSGGRGPLSEPLNRKQVGLRTRWFLTDEAAAYTLTLTFTVIAD
jgi:hypothetical protein